MNPPAWFVKELKVLDPSYFILWNKHYEYWEIKRDMDIDRTDRDTGKKVRIAYPTVAVFKTLNDDALLSLRRRKYIGLVHRQDTLSYLKEIQRENQEAAEKAKELARDQMAEGFIKIMNWGKKKYFLTPARELRR